MKDNKNKSIFPKDFFTESRPHTNGINKSDMPFKWSKNVKQGKSKVKIVSAKNIIPK